MFENEKRLKKLAERIKLADTPDKKIEKMSFREKQRVYAAKAGLSKIFWTSDKGTYIKSKNEERK